MQDPIDHTKELLTRFNIDSDTRRVILNELRKTWGGCQTYIKANDTGERNTAIKNGLLSGKPLHVIAAAAGVSSRTVRRRRAQWLT